MNDMIALEAFLRDQIIIENEELLKKRYPLFVFCETNYSLFEKTYARLAKKYGFRGTVILNFDELSNCFMNDREFDYGDYSEIKEYAERVKSVMNDDMTLGQFNTKLIESFTEYSKKSNQLVILATSQYILYSHSEIREYPMLMANPGRIKLGIELFKSTKKTDTHFNRVFGTKIPNNLRVKHPEKMELFHVSMTQGIKELEPRKTTKPLNDWENVAIPRISTTTSVDACFRAVSPRVGRWYIYQLILTPKSEVIKPNTYLVPDADETGEYWVLTPTKVKEIATIDCKEDPEDKGHFLFTTIKSTTKSDYENLLKGYTVVGG